MAVIQLDLRLLGTVTITDPAPPEPSLAGAWFTIDAGGRNIKGRAPMAYTLVSGTSENLEVAWVDEAGNAAVVDGPVVWASSDGTICPVVVDPADSSKSVMGKGALAGTAQITATGDADIGAGVTTLTAILDVTVIAGQAFAGTITPVGSPF